MGCKCSMIEGDHKGIKVQVGIPKGKKHLVKPMGW